MKTKIINASIRGITFSDDALFAIGTKVKYVIDRENQQLILSPSLESEHEITVSRKKSGEQYKPLIDIRNRQVLELFAAADKLAISIADEVVTVSAQTNEGDIIADFDKSELFSAAGIDTETDTLASAIRVASFFSGAGGLDKGFSNIKDFRVCFAYERDNAAATTYRINHGDHIHVGDIWDLDLSDVPPVDAIICGPPCQGLSNANRHTNYLDNPNNLVLKKQLEIIKHNAACKVFVLENAPQLLTAGNGKFIEEIRTYLSEFQISAGVLNAADFGTAQLRKRAILIGSKIGEIPLPEPSVSVYTTVQQALEGIHEGLPNATDICQSKAETKLCMTYIAPGENWQALPKELRGRKAVGKTHSNIMRRLRWDKPSITLPNVRKSLILHPSEDRVLSVREMARLFDLPDNFIVTGNLSQRIQQLANAVPVRLAQAIAGQVQRAFQKIIPSKTDALIAFIRGLAGDENEIYA